jgi:hypothetical protein
MEEARHCANLSSPFCWEIQKKTVPASTSMTPAIPIDAISFAKSGAGFRDILRPLI